VQVIRRSDMLVCLDASDASDAVFRRTGPVPKRYTDVVVVLAVFVLGLLVVRPIRFSIP